MEAFLGLFDNVPPFFHSPPKGVNLTGGTALALRSSFNLKKLLIQNAINRGRLLIIFSVLCFQNQWSIRH